MNTFVHQGESHIQMEGAEGRLSRWSTLRTMRVLDWFDRDGPESRVTWTQR